MHRSNSSTFAIALSIAVGAAGCASSNPCLPAYPAGGFIKSNDLQRQFQAGRGCTCQKDPQSAACRDQYPPAGPP